MILPVVLHIEILVEFRWVYVLRVCVESILQQQSAFICQLPASLFEIFIYNSYIYDIVMM